MLIPPVITPQNRPGSGWILNELRKDLPLRRANDRSKSHDAIVPVEN